MDDPTLLHFTYGNQTEFQFDPDGRSIHRHVGPVALPDVADATARAIASPIEFPTLSHAMLPDDRVTLAIDPRTPSLPDVVAGIVRALEIVGVQPAAVTVLTPPPFAGEPAIADPLSSLCDPWRSAVQWCQHDRAEEGRCGYLANTVAGQRVYLAHELLDADFVISVGPVAFDPLLGHRGTHSVFYPALSDAPAARQFVGQTHAELGPNEQRPLRQLVDEVGWLLGNQFAVQVVPASGGGVAEVLTGLADAVQREGQRSLAEAWGVTLDHRPETVVVGLDGAAGEVTWDDLGVALEAATALVQPEGRIVVLSELAGDLGEGFQIVRDAVEPADALRPLREAHPDDVLPATALVRAAERSRVLLLSGLPEDLAEDLFLVPLGSAEEAQRSIAAATSLAVLPSAQHIHARVRDE